MENPQIVGTLQETVEKLCEIITLQSDIIDSIFLSLSRYVTQEELEKLMEIEDIKEAAEMKKEAGL